MGLMLIAGDPYGGEERLARTLADALGYRCIAEDAIVERAAASGAPHQELWMTLRCAPGWRDRFLHKNRRYWILLQAALAEEIRQGRVICHGALADFLVLERVPALRVGITAPPAMRAENARQVLLLTGEEAEAFIEMQSEVRRRRLRYLYGMDRTDPSLYDLVIDFGRLTLEEATEAVVQLALTHPALAGEQGREDFLLACRAKAALARGSGRALVARARGLPHWSAGVVCPEPPAQIAETACAGADRARRGPPAGPARRPALSARRTTKGVSRRGDRHGLWRRSPRRASRSRVRSPMRRQRSRCQICPL
jgi:cytidylate kinase